MTGPVPPTEAIFISTPSQRLPLFSSNHPRHAELQLLRERVCDPRQGHTGCLDHNCNAENPEKTAKTENLESIIVGTAVYCSIPVAPCTRCSCAGSPAVPL